MVNLALNYLTKGILYSLPLFKYILHGLRYEITTPTEVIGGTGYGSFIDTVRKVAKKGKIEDITLIKVFVDWKKDIIREKPIYVELLTKQITADLLEEYGEKSKKIKIEIEPEVESTNKKISATLISND